MFIITKIAIRNVLVSRKRSLLLGFVIFLSTFVLLLTNAMANGVEQQVTKGYRYLQAGDTVAIWDNLKKIEASDATRLLFLSNPSFDPNQDQANQQAISLLDQFAVKHDQEISSFFKVVRRNATLITPQAKDAQFSIFGLSEDYRGLLESRKVITMDEGKLPTGQAAAIAISRSKADEYHLKLGDKVDIQGLSIAGNSVSQPFTIEGIYNNGAGWDNYYGFVGSAAAQSFFAYPSGYFDIGKIYYKNSSDANKLSHELDRMLTANGSKVLRSESYTEASQMYPMLGLGLKMVFNLFILILLVIIAIGLRSSIKMSLYERMQEFGTLRAIGFSRGQSFSIIFQEAFFLAVFALAAALAAGLAVILPLSQTGIFVGDGPLSFFGGERLYISFEILDVIIALFMIALFALLSTFSPGLQLLHQNITDILARRQRSIFLPRIIWRQLTRRSTLPKAKGTKVVNQ